MKSIYYAHSHVSYVCAAWGQNLNSKHCLNLLQKKAMQVIIFTFFDAHTLPIFAKLNIIKFPEIQSVEGTTQGDPTAMGLPLYHSCSC